MLVEKRSPGSASISGGRGYEQPPGSSDLELTAVTRGTPMGELLRRYWHPVGLADDASDVPREVRALGEDLILFRDTRGNAGLVQPRCAHRGSNLLYGRVEEAGIRCCYHGWLFDVEGRCLDQPCEKDGGRARGTIRQPWYPVRERYGLVWAYLGPEDKEPALPRYDILEELDPGEFIEADDNSIGAGGPQIAPCNWLQHYENVLDSCHFPWLHILHSGPQFGPLPAGVTIDPAATLAETTWHETARGVKAERSGSIVECVLPTLRVVPNPRKITARIAGRCESIGWVLPLDDTHYRIYTAGRVSHSGELGEVRSRPGGEKLWEDLSDDEHRRFPGDYEAQVSQGAITLHSDEHLVGSDRGVVLLRRLLRRQIAAVAEGRDPLNVSFESDAVPVTLEARRLSPGADAAS